MLITVNLNNYYTVKHKDKELWWNIKWGYAPTSFIRTETGSYRMVKDDPEFIPLKIAALSHYRKNLKRDEKNNRLLLPKS